MEFFLKLVDVGQTQIVPLFTALIDFFETPVTAHLSNITNFFYNFNGLGLISKIIGVNIGDLFANIITKLSSIFGFALDVPTWLFILSNLGIILLLTLIMRVWDLIPIL